MVDPMELSPNRPGTVDVSIDGGVAVLTLRGCLDAATGRVMADAAYSLAADDLVRLDVDLRHITAFDQAGAEALLACRDAGAALEEGLHYRTGQGPGRAALLAAYRRGD